MKAGYRLLRENEIYGDIGVSLLELLGGIILGLCIALLLSALLSITDGVIRNVLFAVISILYISPIVLWLLSWFVAGISPSSAFTYFLHKVIAVAFLSFFTLTQALWALRDRPLIYRLLSAVDDTLPIAFLAMLFGELWASTQGLGFAMTVASATYQHDKGLAMFLLVVAMLAAISAMLRWITKRLYFSSHVSDKSVAI